MYIRYHEPLGKPWEGKDVVPKNVEELDKVAPLLPVRFSRVDEKLFRSGLVFPSQITHLRDQYDVRHIVSLLPGDWLSSWYDNPSVTIHHFPLYRRREFTPDRVKNVVATIDGLEGRVLVFCKKGLTRTGMVVAAHRIKNNMPVWVAAMECLLRGNLNGSAFRDILLYY